MFSFFKKDPPPPPAPPANSAAAKGKLPPPAPQQQPLRTGNRPANFQDPLIASGVSGAFQPSVQNFLAGEGNSSKAMMAAASAASSSGAGAGGGGSGAPRVERMDVGHGDFYTGEVVFSLPAELPPGTVAGTFAAKQAAAAAAAAAATSAVPHGIGELMSDSGRQTYTGYFAQGQREGIGQLVTPRFMLWGFWKHNAVDTASSVRLDSLETLVKYRGFVRAVTGEARLKAELAELQAGAARGAPPLSPFSQWVATTRFVREGWGEAVHPDGRHVFGRWENDELFGFGTQLSGDGERYVGMFHQGKFHGFGVLFLPNGAVCEGDWAHGIFKNANGALTIPNRCVLTGQFTDRNAFSRVNIQLLDTSSMNSRGGEDIDTGLSYVARTQYNSLFFWATNAAVLREEALQHAVPLLALMEKQTDATAAAKLLETEIRVRLVRTKRFDNAVRIAQRVIFLMWGTCGSPSHVHSGNGRTALGIMPTSASSSAASPASAGSSSNNNNSDRSKRSAAPASAGVPLSARGAGPSTAAAAGESGGSAAAVSATAGLATNPGQKPVPPNSALGWCETQRSGGCIHQGAGHPITPQTARQLFDDMLSFATSCRKYWAQLFEIATEIRRVNSGKAAAAGKGGETSGGGAYDDEDDGLLSRDDLLNIVSRAAFDAIFGACRRLAINVFCHAFYSEQVAAEAALERLRDVTLNDVGIEFARQSDDGLFDIYADATRELERSFVSQVPTDILHGLHRWSLAIDSATREAQAAGGSADDLIPIHQFTLLRAKIPHLVPMTKLVSWLGEQPCFVDPTSAESFCLTTLQACVSMLHDLRSNIRDTQGVLQSPSALEARVDDTLSLLDDQGVPVQIVRRAADYCANMLVLLLGHRQQFLRQIAAAAAAKSTASSAPPAATAAAATAAAAEEEASSPSPAAPEDSAAQKKQDPTTTAVTEAVFLLPPDALHIMPQAKQQQQPSRSPSPAAIVGRMRNSSVIHNQPSSSPSPTPAEIQSIVAAAAAAADSTSSVVPTTRPRGQSLAAAAQARSLDEQMLHAVSMLLEATGCQLCIARVSVADAQKPNRIVGASSIVQSSKKNNFGLKELLFGAAAAGMAASQHGGGGAVPVKWCFVARIAPQLLISAPQLKIYTTKLSTL